MMFSAATRFFFQAIMVFAMWAACWESGTPVPMASALLRVGVLLGAVHFFSRGRAGRAQFWLLLLAWAFTVLALIVLVHDVQRWNSLSSTAPFLLAISAWLVGARFE